MFLFPADRPTNQNLRSHLAVDRSVVAELERAETSRLPSSSSSGCVHPACFLRRAAQLSFLQLQTRQVKGQSPLQRAQVVQQPERNALWTGEQRRQRTLRSSITQSTSGFVVTRCSPHLELSEFEMTQVDQRQVGTSGYDGIRAPAF